MQAVRDHVLTAIHEEVELWRTTFQDALNDRDISWPTIPSEPDLFKGAAMLNFGIDATKNIFPNATATTLITELTAAAAKRYALPLFLLGQAQDLFKQAHAAQVASANRQLSERYTALKDQFVRQIHQVARRITNERPAVTIANQLLPHLRGIDFQNERECVVVLREAIARAQLIVTDPQTLRRMVDNTFLRICTTLRDLWRGSYHRPLLSQMSTMWYSGSSQVYLVRDPISGGGRTSQQWQNVRRREDQDWIIRNAWRMEVRFVDRSIWDRREDDCWVTLVESGEPLTAVSQIEAVVSRTEAELRQAVRQALEYMRGARTRRAAAG